MSQWGMLVIGQVIKRGRVRPDTVKVRCLKMKLDEHLNKVSHDSMCFRCLSYRLSWYCMWCLDGWTFSSSISHTTSAATSHDDGERVFFFYSWSQEPRYSTVHQEYKGINPILPGMKIRQHGYIPSTTNSLGGGGGGSGWAGAFLYTFTHFL